MQKCYKLCVCEENNGKVIYYNDLLNFDNFVFKGRKCINQICKFFLMVVISNLIFMWILMYLEVFRRLRNCLIV